MGARDQCSAAGRCGHADDGGDPFRAFSHFSEREAHLAPAGFLNSAALLAPGTAAGWRRGWRRTHAHEGGRHLSREARPSASVPSWLDVQSLETWLEARWSAAWVPLVRDAGGGGQVGRQPALRPSLAANESRLVPTPAPGVARGAVASPFPPPSSGATGRRRAVFHASACAVFSAKGRLSRPLPVLRTSCQGGSLLFASVCTPSR